MMKVLKMTLLAVWLAVSNVSGQSIDTIRFSADRLEIDRISRTVSYSGLESLSQDSMPAVPVFSRTLFYEAELPLSQIDFAVIEADTIGLDFRPAAAPVDQVTSDRPLIVRKLPVVASRDNVYPGYFHIISQSKIKNQFALSLSFFPVQFLGQDTIIFNRTFAVTYPDSHGTAVNKFSEVYAKPDRPSPSPYGPNLSCPLGNELVVITSPDLASAFEPFISLKKRIGFDACLTITDSIYTTYGGIDRADAIRNYLKDFYASGGRYVILGGDEDHVPVRYAYFYNTALPPSPDRQMICDLYFADLDGNWDYDGDGVYGEPTEDKPDLGAELLVGRLPFSMPQQVGAYTEKFQIYLFNPGGGDLSYLTRSVFFASDQMRDYFEGGQQYQVAEKFPDRFEVDCETLAEDPNGIDPAPLGPSPLQSISTMSTGQGLTNILAHGRPDGFILNSSAYNEFPKQYLLTGSDQADFAQFHSLPRNGKVGLYYSISCDQGAFDVDKVYGMQVSPVVEEVLALDSAGAVAMVAFSRWGWVASSYKLMAAFYQHLFDDAGGNPALAMYLSYLDYPYYRDQIYGQNFHGDPSLILYTARPELLTVVLPAHYTPGQTVQGQLLLNEMPMPNYSVTATIDGEVEFTAATDDQGYFDIFFPADCSDDVVVTACVPGQIAASKNLSPSIIADAEDDEPNIPDKFRLYQNFPNPFNPATKIGFSLPQGGPATVVIYNVAGQLVDVLADGYFEAGDHELVWDGRDRFNLSVSSGIYFYRLTSDNGIQTRKMTLIK